MLTPPLLLCDYLERFFRDRLQTQRQVSIHTLHAYRDALGLLVTFAADRARTTPERLTLTQMDDEVVLAFLAHLEQTRGNKVRTRNARRAAIRVFYQYVGYLDPSALGIVHRVLAIPSKRDARPAFEYLTPDELQAVLAVPDRQTVWGRRDYALLLFLATTGARVSEALGVQPCDIHWDGKPHVRLLGKGRKARLVPLRREVVPVLQHLCKERGLPVSTPTPLFVSHTGRPLTRHGVGHLVRRVVHQACARCPALVGRTITPHTFRHTTAMGLLQAGVDLTVIRNWLGHVNLETTHWYLEADLAMKERALEQSGVVPVEKSRYRPPDKVLAFLESL